MAELIATEGAILDVTGNSSITSSSVTILPSTIPSSKVKINGIGVYQGGIDFTVTASISGSCEGATGTGTILPSAIKTKADEQLVHREGDIISGIVVTGATPGGSSCNFTLNVEITDPNQTKVKAD